MYEEQLLQYLHKAIESTLENIFDDVIVFLDTLNHFQIYVNNEGTVRRYELRVYYNEVIKRIMLTFTCEFLFEDLQHHLKKVFSFVEISSFIRSRKRKVAFDETHKDQQEDLQDILNNLLHLSFKDRDKELYYCMQLVKYNYIAEDLQQDVLNDILPAIYKYLLLMFQQKKNDPEFLLVIVTALKKIKKVVKNVDTIEEAEEVLRKFKSVDFSIFGPYYHGNITKKEAMKSLLSCASGCFILFTDQDQEQDQEDDNTAAASLITLRYFIPVEKKGVQKAFFVDERIVYSKDRQVFMVYKHNKVVNSFNKGNLNRYLARKGCPLLANIHFRMIKNQIQFIL